MSEIIKVSIIIPAKDEAERLPDFLGQVLSYTDSAAFACEIIVVNDGSSDQTAEIVSSYQLSHTSLKLINLSQNHGKGYAVREGISQAKGEIVCYTDADGSTPIDEIGKHLHYFDEGVDVVVGSRIVQSEDTQVDAKLHRRYIGMVFNTFVRIFLINNFKDTQCGFKMIRRSTVNKILPALKLDGFGFDLELLYLFKKIGARMIEVGVNWHDVSGSKVNLISDSWKMLLNIFEIKQQHHDFKSVKEEDELVRLQQTLYTSKVPTRRWLHCSRRDWIVEKINTYANDNVKRALEVGPGSGVYLPSLLEVSEQVYASDVEPAYLKGIQYLAVEKPKLSLVQDDITQTHLDPASFDLILCSEVVEHIPDSQPAFESFAKIINSDGTLILSTPQKFSTLELLCKIAFLPGIIQIVRMIYGESILKTGHINLLTEKKLIEQIEQAGFTIVEKYKCGFYLPLVSEFLGEFGLTITQKLERWIKTQRWLDWILWTQCYVLKKA